MILSGERVATMTVRSGPATRGSGPAAAAAPRACPVSRHRRSGSLRSGAPGRSGAGRSGPGFRAGRGRPRQPYYGSHRPPRTDR